METDSAAPADSCSAEQPRESYELCDCLGMEMTLYGMNMRTFGANQTEFYYLEVLAET